MNLFFIKMNIKAFKEYLILLQQSIQKLIYILMNKEIQTMTFTYQTNLKNIENLNFIKQPNPWNKKWSSNIDAQSAP